MLKIYTNTTDFKINEPTVVAIGKFDGDHKGHQKIFEIMRQVKKEKKLKSAVFTFYGSDTRQISPLEEKHRLFEAEGIDYCIEYPFNDTTKSISAFAFLENVLINKLGMVAIVAGSDCTFGYNREGNADFLRKHAASRYDVIIIDKIKSKDTDISSTYIRSLLDEGDAGYVNELLGHPYTMYGKVEEGNHLGGPKLGFATANIYPEEDKLIPKTGVYASRVILKDGKVLSSMTNIGSNPSIKNDQLNHRRRIETHIFDYNDVLYGQEIGVQLLEYIREEIKFDTIDKLKEQLTQDRLQIMRFHDSYKVS